MGDLVTAAILITIILVINLFCFVMAVIFLKMVYRRYISGKTIEAVIFVAMAVGSIGVSFYLFGPVI